MAPEPTDVSCIYHAPVGGIEKHEEAGRTTTTFTDGTTAFTTTYYYVVRSTRNAWRSANSAEASVTTPTPLCL